MFAGQCAKKNYKKRNNRTKQKFSIAFHRSENSHFKLCISNALDKVSEIVNLSLSKRMPTLTWHSQSLSSSVMIKLKTKISVNTGTHKQRKKQYYYKLYCA